jgi:fructose-1,6-bisphosphatase-3
MDEIQLHYLQLLAKQYPSIRAASTAIVDLNAQLHLPKGTEHFLSDIHGEYEAFHHVLKNSSGSIKRKIDEIFGKSLSEEERRTLATLIYYPEEKLPLILKSMADKPRWYRTTLMQLVLLCRDASGKYLRSKVRSFLPEDMAVVIEELLTEQENIEDKAEYYQSIIDTIIATDSSSNVIIALADLIQKLTIARLHVLGDIYDRGPAADQIMDTLLHHHSVDVVWGNHDMLWMGAAAGSEACIANVIRIGLRYDNTSTLEHGYGISLFPLASFAIETYGNDPCECFLPSETDDELTQAERLLIAKMHKAITLLQLKLEGQIIQRRPHYQMFKRLLLDKVDFNSHTVFLDGKVYPLLDTNFPTVDPQHPYELTPREHNLIERLKLSFTSSARLQRHVRFLFSKGSMYLVYNGNLLFHGCIPMNEDGSFKAVQVDGDEHVAGRELMERFDRLARLGYFATDNPEIKQEAMDAMWRLWSDSQSPLFGNEKMATFERYFIRDKQTHVEKRNAYYSFQTQEGCARQILAEFGVNPDTGHIINGHVPVKVARGESPVKASGKLLVIDGGFAKAYQKETGIAGYTLVYNSHGLLLAAHHPFESVQKAVEEERNIASVTQILEQNLTRVFVKDTDLGRSIQKQIVDLQALVAAYRSGFIQES